VSGGATNYVAKFSSATTLTTGSLFDSGSRVGIGTISPNATLDVNGKVIITGSLTSSLDANIYGINVGRGGGSIDTNTAVGSGSLNSNTTEATTQQLDINL